MAGGAVGNGSNDDTAAIQAAINAGIANNWPVHLPSGTYKVTAKLTIDYAGQAHRGFRLISEGATIDGRAIAAGPVLRVRCSGGLPGAPADCFYFKQEGVLFVLADTPDYAVVIGNDDFSDAHNTIKLDHLNVNNRNTDSAAGGCRFNYVLDSDLWAACVSAGGGAGTRARTDAVLADFRVRHRAGHRRTRARARKRLQLRQYVFRSRS